MEIRIESCKGDVTVDGFAAAGEWLEEMQPSAVSIFVGDCEDDLIADIDADDLCVSADVFDATRAAGALRAAWRRLQRA